MTDVSPRHTNLVRTKLPYSQRNKVWLIHGTALLVFLACIAYSLILHHDIALSRHLDSVGTRVIIQYSVAALCMLLAWQNTPSKPNWKSLSLMIAVAIVTRLLLLMTDPYTSNDVARYLFDGHIALTGLDPYQIPHNSAELTELRAQWSPPAEHAKYTTLYPPLALALFSLAATSGVDYAPFTWQLMTTAASLAVLGLAYIVLARADKLRHFALIALSPLLVLEAGEGAHIDIFSALAVLAAVFFWQLKQWKGVGIMLGLGALIKMLPILILLPMLCLLKTWKSRARLAAYATTTWLAGYAAALTLGFKPIGSLTIFFEKWRSGSPLYLWLEPYLSGYSLLFLSIGILLVGFSLTLVHLVLSNRDRAKTLSEDISDGFFSMQLMMAVPLLVSPVIFPWYLLPLATLAALQPSVFVIAWMISLPLLYEVLNQFLCCQQWDPATWPVHGIGITLIAGASADYVLHRRRINAHSVHKLATK